MTVDEQRPNVAARARRVAGWLAAGAVATMVIAASATPAGAAEVGGPTPFGVTTGPTADGQSRPYFNLTLAAGQSATDNVVVTNKAKTTETLKISSSTGITAPNSASAFDGAFRPCVGTGCWVSGLPPTVTLAPGASQTWAFGVTVPAGTAAKQYLAGITAEPQTPPHPVVVGGNGAASAQAVIVDQVSVGVAVTVGSLSALTPGLQISKITGGAAGSVPRLLIGLHNSGQTFTKAQGSAACTVKGTSYSFPVSADTVLPGDAAVLPINAPPIGLGATVPCTVRLTYGQGQIANWSGTVTTPADPPVKVVRTGMGTFSNLPVNHGVPTWAIALIATAAVTLVAMGVLVLWLLRRRRSPDPPAATP